MFIESVYWTVTRLFSEDINTQMEMSRMHVLKYCNTVFSLQKFNVNITCALLTTLHASLCSPW